MCGKEQIINKIEYGKILVTIDYYRLAIDYIRMHVQNPVFYVFTDNKDWVIENFTV